MSQCTHHMLLYSAHRHAQAPRDFRICHFLEALQHENLLGAKRQLLQRLHNKLDLLLAYKDAFWRKILTGMDALVMRDMIVAATDTPPTHPIRQHARGRLEEIAFGVGDVLAAGALRDSYEHFLRQVLAFAFKPWSAAHEETHQRTAITPRKPIQVPTAVALRYECDT